MHSKKVVVRKNTHKRLPVRENMRTQNTQQYHAFIQKFFSLFDEIKEEDDPIYNARIDFNAVRFLIENPNWNLDENKDEAREAIFQKYDEIKKPNQKLQEEAKGILNEYIDEDGVKEVSIYDNHANIALKDNKKEFKISEFLNSGFCQKNGISGFSTLHSDGKSGMHGFIVEEGKEKRKVRHYVVTDGSYEMTLNWYDKDGKKCTIKIKIDKEGVDLIERNGVTEEQLEANKDVKIGGLFLHQIQFKEKGQEQENKQSSETFIGSNSKNVGVQAYREPQSNSSYDSGIEEDLDNAQGKHKLRQAARKENLDAKVHNFQLPFKENLQNKRTPPPPPLRTSSLKKDISDEQEPRNQKLDRNERENSISSNQQQSKTQQQEKGEDLFQDIRNFKRNNLWHVDVEREKDKRPTFTTFGYTASVDRNEHILDNQQQKRTSPPPLKTNSLTSKGNIVSEQTSAKPASNNQDNRQEDKRYDNPTFGYAVPGSQKSERSEQQPKIQQQEGNSKDDLLQDIRNFKRKSLRHTGVVDGSEASVERSKENNSWEKLKDELPYSPFSGIHEHDSDNRGASNAEWEESEQPLSAQIPKSNSAPICDKSHEQSKKSLEDIEQKEIRQEAELPKDSPTDIKTNDSGYSSPTYTSHYNFQVNSEQSKKSLENIEPKKEDTLEKLDKGLRESAQQPKDLFLGNILEKIKEGKQYDPICKWLEKKVAEQENADTNLTIDQNSELYKFLEKDATQLKDGIIEEEKETEHIGSPLEKLDKELKGPAQQAKNSFSENILEKVKEGKQYDPIRKWVEKKVAEQENADTNPTIDKNSELYKFLEKDATQLKDGIVEEEKETEHIGSPRVALANKNRKLLWTKRIAEQQEKDDGINVG